MQKKTVHCTSYERTRHSSNFNTTLVYEITFFAAEVTRDSQLFVCEPCGNLYNRKDNLKTHMKTHGNREGSQKACKYCQKKFHSSSVRRHELRAHESKPKPKPNPMELSNELPNMIEHEMTAGEMKATDFEMEIEITNAFNLDQMNQSDHPFNLLMCYDPILSWNTDIFVRENEKDF